MSSIIVFQLSINCLLCIAVCLLLVVIYMLSSLFPVQFIVVEFSSTCQAHILLDGELAPVLRRHTAIIWSGCKKRFVNWAKRM